MTSSDDPLSALAQLIVRLRSADANDRPAVVAQLLPLLADVRVPLNVRLATAGRALEALPDTPQAVQGVVRALTAGLSLARALDRLRQLQHLTEKSDAIDAMIARRERKVKMSCPRCGVRLPRPEMAKHLWHEHGLTLVKGKTRSRAKAVEAIRRDHATSGDPALLDRIAALAGEPAVRGWAAETATEEETIPLCAAARERGVGLCPTCFADISPAVPELPPPLALANGRLAGDGHVATARGRVFQPRLNAALAASGVLVLFTLLALAAPVRMPVFAILAIAFTIMAYVGGYLLSIPRGTPDDRAIDTAWRKFAHKLADRRDAARFLTRLCLTSIGRGDPFERANALNSIVARSREAPAERQLLAVALTLQVDDAGRYGRDHPAAIAELVAPAFRADQPAEFAEFVLTAYFHAPREASELARLRILLLEAAFAAGLTARDVLDLCHAAPNVAKAMQLPPHHLAELFGVWVHRNAAPWRSVDEAQSVFELAREAPTTATRLLGRVPDVLLVCDSPQDAPELDPVLVCASGVSVGEALTADPAAEVRVEADGHALIFDKSRLKLEHAIPAEFADELKAWLRFRAEVLAAYPAIYLRGDPPPAAELLAAFAVRCSACGTESLPAIGAVARSLRS